MDALLIHRGNTLVNHVNNFKVIILMMDALRGGCSTAKKKNMMIDSLLYKKVMAQPVNQTRLNAARIDATTLTNGKSGMTAGMDG